MVTLSPFQHVLQKGQEGWRLLSVFSRSSDNTKNAFLSRLKAKVQQNLDDRAG